MESTKTKKTCIKDYLEKSYDERVKRDRKRNRETKRNRNKNQLRDEITIDSEKTTTKRSKKEHLGKY